MKPLTRRSVTTGLAAAVTAIPALAFCKGAGEADLFDRVRTFARQLVTDTSARLTAGEWVERKRIANTLLALIGDEFEPWATWEVELLAERDSRRGGVWELRS